MEARLWNSVRERKERKGTRKTKGSHPLRTAGCICLTGPRWLNQLVRACQRAAASCICCTATLFWGNCISSYFLLCPVGNPSPLSGEKLHSMNLLPCHLFTRAEMSSGLFRSCESAIAAAKEGLATYSSTSAGKSKRRHLGRCAFLSHCMLFNVFSFCTGKLDFAFMAS